MVVGGVVGTEILLWGTGTRREGTETEDVLQEL